LSTLPYSFSAATSAGMQACAESCFKSPAKMPVKTAARKWSTVFWPKRRTSRASSDSSAPSPRAGEGAMNSRASAHLSPKESAPVPITLKGEGLRPCSFPSRTM
jgi:hypothetical protein